MSRKVWRKASYPESVLTRKLILFDIDGTLLYAGKTPSEVFAESIGFIIGKTVEFPKQIFFGRTDTFIIREMLRQHLATPADGEYHRIREHFIHSMKEHFPHSDDGFLIPGVREYLDTLKNESDIHLGLVTGNFKETAFVKLSRFGLDDYFETGGFGDEAEDRQELLRQAVEKATRHYGKCFSSEQIVVIGDTLHDIHSAHHWGYRSVAVSHIRNKDTLLEGKPDILIENYMGLKGSQCLFE